MMSRLIDDEEALQDNGLIEVDGVNVAECEFYSSQQKILTALNDICVIDNACILHQCTTSCTNKNCYFKQLQRLKAENEKWLKQYDKLQEDRVKLWTDNTRFKQALEEIREIAKREQECECAICEYVEKSEKRCIQCKSANEVLNKIDEVLANE